jgi:hypothetical protein
MAKLIDVPQNLVSETITALRSETHRGAAVLGGSLVDNALGHFLSCYCARYSDKETVKRLLGANGPISTFFSAHLGR